MAPPLLGTKRGVVLSQQEEKLFEALVRQNADSLHVYLTACTTNRALADEVFQDTLIVAWRRLEDYDVERPFGAWTRGIARNVLMSKLRERSSAPITESELLVEIDARVNALEQQPGDSLHEKLACLRRCLGGLAERDRGALEARYEDGLRGSKLAERLQTSAEAAKKVVQRARAKVFKCMQTQVVWE